MKGWSEAVGAGLGYFVGGPIGAVLGLMVGHRLAPRLPPEEGHLLVANLLGFAAVLLKAEGFPAAEQRRQSVHFISDLFRFDPEDEKVGRRLLEQLLALELDIAAMARSCRRRTNPASRERLLEILATLCLLLYGPLQGRRLELLSQIATGLKLEASHWQQLCSRYQRPSPVLDLACSYALLGVHPGAPVAEVRSAYRRLAKRYHPDRPSPDPREQNRRAERMRLINAAYETIRLQAQI